MQPPPQTPPIDVKLTVEAAKHGNDPVVWEMSDGTKKGGPNNYPTVVVPNKGHANFTITIKDPGTITFSNDPIWIDKGLIKPTSSVVKGIKDVTGGGTTVLKFYDGNKDPGKLTYVLNFDNVPAGTPKQLDPIIDNQGGGPGMMRDYAAMNYYYAAGAVLLLAVLVFVFMRRRSASRPADVQRSTDINKR
jgi:hypothetical protein